MFLGKAWYSNRDIRKPSVDGVTVADYKSPRNVIEAYYNSGFQLTQMSKKRHNILAETNHLIPVRVGRMFVSRLFKGWEMA